MTTYHATNVLDILFQNKNKDYGAYYHYQVYPEHIKKSMFILLGIFGSFIVGYTTYQSLHHVPITTTTCPTWHPIDVDMTPDLPKKSFEVPKELQSKGGSVNAQVPVIVKEERHPEVEIHTSEALLNPAIALGNSDIGDGEGTAPASVGQAGIASAVPVEAPFVAVPEVFPSFPGGEEELGNYLKKTKYPIYEQENDIEGVVEIGFVVNEDGSISNIQILNCDREGFNKEALKLVKAMPRWNPGKQDGKPVKVPFSIPFVFKLKDDN